VADRLAHVAHLPRAALVQGDRDKGLVLPRAQPCVDEAHHGRGRAPPLDGDAAPQPPQVGLVRHAAHPRVVLALDLVLGVEQALHERAVVCEQQQPFRVVVEAAHGVDVLADTGQQVQHGGPALRVLPGGHVATRLVEQDVPVPRRDAHALPVHADVVAIRVGLRPQLDDGGTVDRHAAARDEHLRGASRRDAGRGQDLLEAFGGHVHSLMKLAKKSTSCQISRQPWREFNSAWVITRLSSVRTRVWPSRYRPSQSDSTAGITLSSVPWST
jgi:hypothetical protein